MPKQIKYVMISRSSLCTRYEDWSEDEIPLKTEIRGGIMTIRDADQFAEAVEEWLKQYKESTCPTDTNTK